MRRPAPPPTRILVVEDARDMSALIAHHLAQAGYRVRTARDGAQARAELAAERPDLVVVDLMLPCGREVLEEIRARDVPVIALGVPGDDVAAHTADCIARPFSPRELVPRIADALRHARSAAASERMLRGGPVLVDLVALRASVDGVPLDLTPTEYRLLAALLEHRGEVQSRQELLENAWGIHVRIATRTVDIHVKRLRDKLGPGGDWIETVRGLGYRFRAGDHVPFMRRGGTLRSWVVLGAAFAVWTGQAAAQRPEVTLEHTGRVQIQYNTTNADADDVASTTFEARRVRLGTRFTVEEWLSGMAEVELALGDLAMRNVWANFAFSDGFQLRTGQFKKPFSVIEQTSSSQILTIERGVRIRGLADALLAADTAGGNPILSRFGGDPLVGEEQALISDQGYSGFELGAAFHGTAGTLEWEIGIFNGSGEDRRDTNDDKSFAARATLGLPGTALTLGAGTSRRELGVGDESLSGTAFEVDAEWGSFRSPLHIQAELAFGDNIAADESFLGAHLVGAVFRSIEGARVEGWELVGRASWGDPNRSVDGDEGLLLTPGAALYFPGRNRIQFNWDVFVPSGDRFETMHALRAQAQVYF